MLLKIFLADNPAKISFDVIVFSFWQREKFSGKVGLPVVYSDRGWLKIDNSLVQRQKQIALLFPKWNFSYNSL